MSQYYSCKLQVLLHRWQLNLKGKGGDYHSLDKYLMNEATEKTLNRLFTTSFSLFSSYLWVNTIILHLDTINTIGR